MLEPDEVRERDFAVRSDGYDPDEVDEFMTTVAETIATLTSRVESAPSSEGPSSYADVGKAAQRVLEAADASAQDIVDEARGEADRLREEARNDREQAARELEEVERRQREHAEVERRAHEVIRSAGQSTRQLLNEAAAPREQLISTLDEARRLLLERFEEAEDVAQRVGQRAEQVAQELEVELPFDFGAATGDGDDATAQDPRFEGLELSNANEAPNQDD